jgi:hypothetical protein
MISLQLLFATNFPWQPYRQGLSLPLLGVPQMHTGETCGPFVRENAIESCSNRHYHSGPCNLHTGVLRFYVQHLVIKHYIIKHGRKSPCLMWKHLINGCKRIEMQIWILHYHDHRGPKVSWLMMTFFPAHKKLVSTTIVPRPGRSRPKRSHRVAAVSEAASLWEGICLAEESRFLCGCWLVSTFCPTCFDKIYPSLNIIYSICNYFPKDPCMVYMLTFGVYWW